jgi:transposase InsO family protein
VTLVEEAVQAGARQEVATQTLGLTARTLQRWAARGPGSEDRRLGPHTSPGNKLSAAERRQLLEVANTPEYRDLPPAQIVPRLADEQGIYLASESTLYRVLRQEQQLAHRERSRPATTTRPSEQVATGPLQVWSWDITWLPGPIRGTFFYLYLIVDVWSRKIVGGVVHEEESSELASQLFHATCWREGLDPEGLVLHSDNGSPMKGATMLATLQRLGVIPSFSRPRVSNDNPYSESLFRTLKYRPEYPSEPFATLGTARAWVSAFIDWYNTEHRHSAIRYVTPTERHDGREEEVLERRHRLYETARQKHPERWTGAVRNWTPIATVRLNPEPQQTAVQQAA